ncbi:hypothetical protein LPJ57_005291 [Coemansia sp. RSA 486]|nr:hypothetical protein LPJ57_005291 [Coemansia sp. RSA 486]
MGMGMRMRRSKRQPVSECSASADAARRKAEAVTAAGEQRPRQRRQCRRRRILWKTPSLLPVLRPSACLPVCPQSQGQGRRLAQRLLGFPASQLLVLRQYLFFLPEQGFPTSSKAVARQCEECGYDGRR